MRFLIGQWQPVMLGMLSSSFLCTAWDPNRPFRYLAAWSVSSMPILYNTALVLPPWGYLFLFTSLKPTCCSAWACRSLARRVHAQLGKHTQLPSFITNVNSNINTITNVIKKKIQMKERTNTPRATATPSYFLTAYFTAY